MYRFLTHRHVSAHTSVLVSQVYANKMILSMWSPVFEAMFHDDFREKTAREIELPGKSRRACVEMMEVLHPPNKDISSECGWGGVRWGAGRGGARQGGLGGMGKVRVIRVG